MTGENPDGGLSRAAARRRAWLIVAAFAVLYTVWGSTYLAIKFAIQTLPPLGMAGARFVVAGAIMYAFARWRSTARPTALQWASAAFVGLLLLLGGNGLVVIGQHYVPSGIAALFIASQSIWIGLLSVIVPGMRPAGWLAWGGMAVALLGLAYLVGLDGHGVSRFGGAVLLCSSLSWSLGTIIGQTLQRRAVSTQSLVLGTGMQMLAGGAGLFAASLVRAEWGTGMPVPSAASLAGWAYLVTFGSILGFTAYVWLLTQVSAGAVATYAFVNPIVAVILGWALAGEAISGRTALAALVIVAGVALIIFDGLRARDPRPRRAADPLPNTPSRAPAMAGE